MHDEIMIAHQSGLGEFFICNGLVNYFSQCYKKIYLPVSVNNYPTVKHLYSDNPRVNLLQWTEKDYVDVDYLDGYNMPLIDVNCWNNRPRPNHFWYRYYYEQFGLSYDLRFTNSNIPNYTDRICEKIIPSNDYIVVHNSSSAGNYNLNIQTGLEIIYVDNTISSNLVDWQPVFENATEIHAAPSSVFCLVDSLRYHKKIKAKLYYHDIRLTNAPIDHTDLRLTGWNVIDYTTKI